MRTWVSSLIVGRLTDLDEDSRLRLYSVGRDKSDMTKVRRMGNLVHKYRATRLDGGCVTEVKLTLVTE